MIRVNRENIERCSYVKIRKKGERSKKIKKSKVIYVMEDAKAKAKSKDLEECNQIIQLLIGAVAIEINVRSIGLYFSEQSYMRKTPEIEIINNIAIVHALNRLLAK